MHNIKPLRNYKIITVKLAVSDDAKLSDSEDRIGETLNNLLIEDNSILADWSYKKDYSPDTIVTSSSNPFEGELFGEQRQEEEQPFNNQMLRIYGKNNKVIKTLLVKDSTPQEANNSVMHYIEAYYPNCDDWSLTTVVERDKAFKILGKPKLVAIKNDMLSKGIAQKFDVTVEIVQSLNKFNPIS